jgi:uncharacterized membrane protein YccC
MPALDTESRADSWVSRHRLELGLSLRMTVAGLLAFAVGHLIHVAQIYWAVLTAVIVMQASVGGSLKASLDRFVGTLGGAVWGVAVTVAIPYPGVLSTGLGLAAALIPLSLLVAFKPSYRVAPVTAAIVLLGHAGAGGVVDAALDRVLEISLGSVVALAVALAVAPARAHRSVYAAAADALSAMAEQIAALTAGVAAAVDPAATLARNDRIRAAIERASATADEAARERRSYISDAPDPEPLVRGLRRLSHDLIMVARALPTMLPDAVSARLAEPASRLGIALAARMTGIGGALAKGAALPSVSAVANAVEAYGAAVAGLRSEGVTVKLPTADVERIFGLSFAFEQLRLNLDELAGRVGELSP